MARTAKNLRNALPGLWNVLRYFWPEVRSQRKLIVGALAALLAGVVFRLLEPWPLKFVIDRVIPGWTDPPNGGSSSLADVDSRYVLLFACAAVVVIAAARAGADYASKVGFFVIGNHAVINIRNRVFRHLHSLSLSFHNRSKTGDLVIRVTRDVSLLRDVTATAALPLLASMLVLVGMLAVMAWLDWKLTLVALLTVPLFSLATLRIGKRIRQSARKQRQREGAMAGLAAESIGAIDVVQALSLESIFCQAFSQTNRAGQKADLKANRYSVRLGRTVDVLLSISTALVMYCGAQLVLNTQLSPGELLVFLVYVKRAFKPAQEFAKYTARMSKAAAAGERVIEVLEEQPDIMDGLDAMPAPKLRGQITFEGVGFRYDGGRPVLHHIDFQMVPGQRVAVVGESGVGKTTLLRLVLRLYDPTSGRIFIDGHDLRSVVVSSLRGQIAFVPQESPMFSASVFDNIACHRPATTLDQVRAAARRAHAHDFIEALPEGYDTVIGERGVTLSAGQRLRLSIARAAVRGAPIVLLDEPTASLDEENRLAVADAVDQLWNGCSVLLATHDLSLASRADIILFLHDGHIAESGSHSELVAAANRYAALYRLQTAPPVSAPHDTRVRVR